MAVVDCLLPDFAYVPIRKEKAKKKTFLFNLPNHKQLSVIEITISDFHGHVYNLDFEFCNLAYLVEFINECDRMSVSQPWGDDRRKYLLIHVCLIVRLKAEQITTSAEQILLLNFTEH